MHPHRRDRLDSPRTTIRLLTGLVLVSASFACAGPEEKNVLHQEPTLSIYVIRHAWHTGIAIAGEHLGPELGFLDDHFATANWYEIGWGDRRFYQADETTVGLTLQAAMWPTDSVLHVTALPEKPDTYFSNNRVIEIAVGQSGHERMVSAIAEYFERNQKDDAIVSGDGLYGESLFFEATGNFHVFNNCNTWTARLLKRAGVSVRTRTMTAGSVMSQLEAVAVSDTGVR